MSKDFDAALSAAIDHAANAAHPAGASAARATGRKRTMRKRIAISATSAVIVAAGMTAAFKAASASDGKAGPGQNPTPGVHSTGPTPSSTPSSPNAAPSTSGTPGAPGIPGTSSTPGTPPGTTPSTPSAPTNPTTSGAPVTDSGRLSWLTPGHVPFDNLMSWTTKGSPTHCSGSEEFSDVYLGYCSPSGTPAAPHTAVTLDTQLYKSNGVPTGNGAWVAPAAAQEFFTYKNASDATAAYQAITHRLLTEDAGFNGAVDTTRNLPVVSTTTTTAQTADGMAIDHRLRDDDGTPAEVNGEYSAYSDYHFYFAVRGKVVVVVEIQGGPSISGTSNDAAILQAVTGTLG